MNTNEFEEIGKFTINDQLIYFGVRSGGKTKTFMTELEKQQYIKQLYESCTVLTNILNLYPDWKEVTKTLGDVKGIVSTEDRQLLKIVHNLSDEDVDKMISEYKNQYKIYLKNSKMYGKEKWRN